MWVGQSIRPGRTVARERSITSAPAGMARPGPTAVMRSPSMRMTALGIAAAPLPSIRWPARTARRRGGALSGAGAAIDRAVVVIVVAASSSTASQRARFIACLLRSPPIFSRTAPLYSPPMAKPRGDAPGALVKFSPWGGQSVRSRLPRALWRLPLLLLPRPAAAAAPAAETVPREWLTPAEVAGFAATPSYDEKLAFLRRLQTRFPEMYLGFYGTSGQGRPLPFVVVSKEKTFTAEAAGGKPVVLIQNGIHAGEIDGKDASLMILRDLALGRHRELLDAVTLVVIPIYNVDGHERVSPFNRPNQDGPSAGMGFRTTSDGLDLNRDYLKSSSPEARCSPRWRATRAG